LVIRTFKTVKSLNPQFKDYLIITDSDNPPKAYFIPEREFTELIIKAGKRFNTLAPLAPYPSILGVEWKTNSTIYKWFRKRLIQIQERYNLILGL